MITFSQHQINQILYEIKLFFVVYFNFDDSVILTIFSYFDCRRRSISISANNISGPTIFRIHVLDLELKCRSVECIILKCKKIKLCNCPGLVDGVYGSVKSTIFFSYFIHQMFDEKSSRKSQISLPCHDLICSTHLYVVVLLAETVSRQKLQERDSVELWIDIVCMCMLVCVWMS